MSVTGITEDYEDCGEDSVRLASPEPSRPANNFWSEGPAISHSFTDISRRIEARAAEEIERKQRWDDYVTQCVIMMRN